MGVELGDGGYLTYKHEAFVDEAGGFSWSIDRFPKLRPLPGTRLYVSVDADGDGAFSVEYVGSVPQAEDPLWRFPFVWNEERVVRVERDDAMLAPENWNLMVGF